MDGCRRLAHIFVNAGQGSSRDDAWAVEVDACASGALTGRLDCSQRDIGEAASR